MEQIIFGMKWLVLALILISGCAKISNIDYCNSDADCVPKPGCHSRECINLERVDEYEQPEVCTTLFDCSAAYNEEDCLCHNNKCVNKNLDGDGCER